MVSLCERLNPFLKDGTSLRLCLNEKIADINWRVPILDKQIDDELKKIIAESTNCILEENGKTQERIGAILGAMRSCKNLGYSI